MCGTLQYCNNPAVMAIAIMNVVITYLIRLGARAGASWCRALGRGARQGCAGAHRLTWGMPGQLR